MKILRTIASGILLLAVCASAQSRFSGLRDALNARVASTPGRIGVAVIDLQTGDTVTVRGSERFPMQSVFKFHVALAMLKQVDRGIFSLKNSVTVLPGEIRGGTWSPLREKYPAPITVLPLDEMLRATVAQSDNNGCDILFRLLGGPARVDSIVRSFGVEGVAIVGTELDMSRDSLLQYRNYSTPLAMARLLKRWAKDSILSRTSTVYLWDVMTGTTTGPKRLKGKLPAGTVVAHKTGSSGTNAAGIAAATNDSGILVLPDGRRVAVAVFVSDSPASEAEREGVIADVAKLVWDSSR